MLHDFYEAKKTFIKNGVDLENNIDIQNENKHRNKKAKEYEVNVNVDEKNWYRS